MTTSSVPVGSSGIGIGVVQGYSARVVFFNFYVSANIIVIIICILDFNQVACATLLSDN